MEPLHPGRPATSSPLERDLRRAVAVAAWSLALAAAAVVVDLAPSATSPGLTVVVLGVGVVVAATGLVARPAVASRLSSLLLDEHRRPLGPRMVPGPESAQPPAASMLSVVRHAADDGCTVRGAAAR